MGGFPLPFQKLCHQVPVVLAGFCVEHQHSCCVDVNFVNTTNLIIRVFHSIYFHVLTLVIRSMYFFTIRTQPILLNYIFNKHFNSFHIIEVTNTLSSKLENWVYFSILNPGCQIFFQLFLNFFHIMFQLYSNKWILWWSNHCNNNIYTTATFLYSNI